MSSPADLWIAIVPVKPWRLAKTRLLVAGCDRIELARAFALDAIETVHAAPSVGRVVVVSGEPELASLTTHLPHVTVLVEQLSDSVDKLNTAIEQGRRWVMDQRSESRTVVVPADLATLTVPALEQALGLLSHHDLAHIPDEQGSGTTLLAARTAAVLTPRYGLNSADCHSAAGSNAVLEVGASARLDIDSRADLELAIERGLTPRARAVVPMTARRGLSA